MAITPVELRPGYTVASEVAADIRLRLLDELQKSSAPLVREVGAALAYLTPAGATWIVPSNACPCSHFPGAPLRCHDADPTGSSGQRHVELSFEGRPAGAVFVCRASAAQATALGHLAVGALRRIESERANLALRATLATSREQLQAVYDVNSHMAAARSVQELLELILARITAAHEGVRTALWLLQDGELRLAARTNAPLFDPRPPADGLVGRVIALLKPALGAAPVVLTGVARPEPEFLRAAGVAVLPIHARSQPLGALAVWHERDPLPPSLLKLLETLAFLITVVLESDRFHRDFLERERVRHDAEIASGIQQALLLGTPPVDLQRIVAAAATTASCQVDGDFYDFFAFDQTLDVVIGDVMGKGITAALVGAATKTYILRAINCLFASNPGRLPEVREIMGVVSADLFKKLAKIGCFVTLCYARFDLRREQVELVDCGHPSTIHWKNDSAEHTLLRGDNMPLGFGEGEEYKQISAPFRSGDVFFFYSDGVTEARNTTGQFFGVERLARMVGANANLSPRDLAERVRKHVLAYAHPGKPGDDITCVVVKIGDMMATLASVRATLEIVSDTAALPDVRTFLRDQCRSQPLQARAAFEQFEQALIHAANLVISEAYLGRRDGALRFESEVFMHRIAVRIYHRGQALDPDLSGTVTGSAAAILTKTGAILQRVDTLRYTRDKYGENCLYLAKSLVSEPPKGV